MRVSVDSSFLYELKSRSDQIAKTINPHNIVLMADREECKEISDLSFSGRFSLGFLPLPLKYDELQAALNSPSIGGESRSREKRRAGRGIRNRSLS